MSKLLHVVNPVKVTEPHWYSVYIEYCPICGRDRTTKTREKGKRPDDYRPEFHEVWDYCDAL